MKRTIRLSFGGNGRNSSRSAYDFLKPEFVGMYGKRLFVDYDDRSDLVRQFMGVFLKKEFTAFDIRVIIHFLKRFHLSKAEINAVVFHLGFRYVTPRCQGNLKIDGYYDAKKENLKE